MIKLLIFDLDGTLSNTLPSLTHALSMTMTAFGLPSPTEEQTAAALGSGAKELLVRLLPSEVSADEEKFAEILAYYNKMYKTTYMEADRCYDGMAEAVLELKRRGYTLAVLSNKRDDYVKNIVAQLFDKEIMSDVRGQSDLPTKPDPTVPLMMTENLGFTPDETAFIGDSDVDILTANNAKMTAVACSWGFRPRAQLERLAPKHLIDSPMELLDIFG